MTTAKPGPRTTLPNAPTPPADPPATDPTITDPTITDPAVTMADVAALTRTPAVTAPPAPGKPAPFLSEGMRHDLETAGYAIDPVSGAKFSRDKETGEITVTARKGD